MATVYNKSKQQHEEADLIKCPRCSGFGHSLGDDGDCSMCDGNGQTWLSKSGSGWTRPKGKHSQSSTLG